MRNDGGDGILRVSPAPREIWERMACEDPNALVFQSPRWTDGLLASGKYEDVSRYYELKDTRRLLLPLVRSKSGALSSMPDGWGAGGLLSSHPLRPDDVSLVLADLASMPAARVTLRPNPLIGATWELASPSAYQTAQRRSHILSLEGGFNSVWSQRFSTATRTKIRKAEKSGLQIQRGLGGDLLPEFYDVYMHWVDRRAHERHLPLPLARWLGRRREPLFKFEHAARALGDAFRVWVVRLDGQPVAAAILLIGSAHAHYWRSASIKELAGPVRANDLLQLRMIEDACTAGCLHYHMGESGGVDSLMHFKSRFGAEEVPYPGFYREHLAFTGPRRWLRQLAHQIESRFVRAA